MGIANAEGDYTLIVFLCGRSSTPLSPLHLLFLDFLPFTPLLALTSTLGSCSFLYSLLFFLQFAWLFRGLVSRLLARLASPGLPRGFSFKKTYNFLKASLLFPGVLPQEDKVASRKGLLRPLSSGALSTCNNILDNLFSIYISFFFYVYSS